MAPDFKHSFIPFGLKLTVFYHRQPIKSLCPFSPDVKMMMKGWKATLFGGYP
jgi:hypothetical protein